MPNKPPGRPFVKGDPRAGRPKGSQNKTGRDARILAQSLVTDPEYLGKLRARLIDGKAGDLEKTLWLYAFGAPPQHPVSIMDDFFEGIAGNPGNENGGR
jgi:hypothetical protein